MHIQQAKKQIKNAIIAYNSKDSYGRYKIPISKQRPVFLVGAPGIGKTAIVEQIAQELDIAYVSYSMTHHTRQSALGLPFIVKKEYDGKEYSVSEYTMSEILSSVYEEKERTHKQEGVLFLDEINCVSETLAPSMLQFLQYKTFGQHRVPEGWIVVTAGNPAEYNDSVREFDIAMLDRLKKIEVEPDFEVWKDYALKTGVHSVILSYLSIKPQYFYRLSMTVDGKNFVTARSWDDLSQMITLYEENNLEVDMNLISQYIQDEEISKDFSNYYDLYHKYKSDYQINEILDGSTSIEIIKRAKQAKFDERLSLISLILSSLEDSLYDEVIQEESLKVIISEIKKMKDYHLEMEQRIQFYSQVDQGTKEHLDEMGEIISIYKDLLNCDNTYDSIKENLQVKIKGLNIKEKEKKLDNVFVFFESAFGQGQEMTILVSECTIRPGISKFIMNHGCEKYYQYNKQLLLEDTKDQLMKRIKNLNLLEMEENND